MNWYSDISGDNIPAIDSVLELARTCNVNLEQAGIVTTTALRLFDQFKEMYSLGYSERFWLVCAGALYNIGKVDNNKGHHKASLNIILATPILPFTNRERFIVGSITRFYSGKLARKKKDHILALEPYDQNIVMVLASFLRLAVGLDRSQADEIQDITCKVGHNKITLEITGHKPHKPKKSDVEKYTDLMEQVFDHKIHLVWKQPADLVPQPDRDPQPDLTPSQT